MKNFMGKLDKELKKKLLCAAILLYAAPALLCGCGKKAAEDEVLMKLSEKETLPVQEQQEEPSEEESQNIPLLYVYICGAVENPGVYQLEAGSRLYEAVERAGGLTADADGTAVNLARQVADGEQVMILTQDEVKELEKQGKYFQGQYSAPQSEDSLNASQAGALVNINTATVAELTSVSGIGTSRAQAIIAYRESNGGFKCIEDIKKVDGIKDGLFSKIKDKITVNIN